MTRDPSMETAIVSDIYYNELILMPFLEHYVTLPHIKRMLNF
jgi:hypothetical protein